MDCLGGILWFIPRRLYTLHIGSNFINQSLLKADIPKKGIDVVHVWFYC